MREIPFFVELAGGNSGITDAFGRVRVSEPLTLFDSKQLHDKLPFVYDDAEVSGSGTSSTYNANQASTTIAVTNLTAGQRVRQTFERFNYQPGKSKSTLLTFNVGTVPAGGSGCRVGTFDTNNGVYFQVDGEGLAFGIRSSTSGSPVDTLIRQADWNLRKLDGTEANLPALDASKTNILIMDFEWLGVGTVRFGFIIDGVTYYCHNQHHANLETLVYMSTPNLPVRYEVFNDGTGNAASLNHICSTVISEGGLRELGRFVGLSRGSDGILITTSSDTWYPLISVRLNSAKLDAVTRVYDYKIATDGSAATLEIGLFRNPGINGVDAASWLPVTNSAIEYDISRTTANTLNLTTNNQNIGIETIATSQGGGGGAVTSDNIPVIGSSIAGVSDEFVFAVRRIDGGNVEVYASMNMRELI